MEPRIIVAHPLRRVARQAVHLAREMPLWARLRLSGDGPRVLALPARGVEDGAARLRIHALMPGLRQAGWVTLVVPPSLRLGQRKRLIGAFAPDVILMQGVRHPLNRPAFYPGLPIASVPRLRRVGSMMFSGGWSNPRRTMLRGARDPAAVRRFAGR